MKKTLLAAALFAASTTVFADTSISGQVNSAWILDSDVDGFDPTVVDNNTTGTRFRIESDKKIGDGYKAGMRLEYQFQDNQSNRADLEGGDSADTLANDRSEVRYSDVYVSTPFGKFAIGKGDGAANGTFESYGILNFLGASESHLLFNGVGSAYTDIDGISRQNRFRYDSPKFAGFKVALSFDNGDQQEFAAEYDGKVLGGKLLARVGLVDGGTIEVDGGAPIDFNDVLSASIAYKFGFGLGLAYSYGETENVDGDTTKDVDWAMISYDIGKKLTISYGVGEEGEGANDDELAILSANFKPAKGVEIYLNYGDFDNGGGDTGDAIALGSRFRF